MYTIFFKAIPNFLDGKNIVLPGFVVIFSCFLKYGNQKFPKHKIFDTKKFSILENSQIIMSQIEAIKQKIAF